MIFRASVVPSMIARLVALSARRDREASGPGTFHARLYDALYALTPESLDDRANISDA